MKKSAISVALVAGFALVALAPAAFAADGKITFTGAVSDATCTITGGGAAVGTGDLAVGMPTVQASALTATAQVAGDTPFSIVLGGAGQVGCLDGKTASLNWEVSMSPQIDATTGNLNNLGTATNVQVSVLNNANLPINLSTGTNPSTAVIAGNTATLAYTAQYFATGAATAGTVNTDVTYSVVYN